MLLPRSYFQPTQTEIDWSHPSNVNTDAPSIYTNENLAFLDRDQPAESSYMVTDEELAAGPPPLFTMDPSFQSACSSFQVNVDVS